MAVVLNISPVLGRTLRQARKQRGWTTDDLTAELGRIGDPPYALGRTQLTRLEAGRRNLSAAEAWRFVEVFGELNAWDLLEAARIVDANSPPEFRAAVEAEASRRREVMAERGRPLVPSLTRVGGSETPTASSHAPVRRAFSDQQGASTGTLIVMPGWPQAHPETGQVAA